MVDWVDIGSDRLRATINPLGAELSSMRDGDGRELMTDADPAFWSGRAPLLFPVIGRVHDDTILVDGQRYPMPKHGFARRSTFALGEHSADRAQFTLADSAQTRAAYPFAFLLDVTFAVAGATLEIAVGVTNPADRPLPMSFGFHPALAWPLPFGGARSDHRIVFETPEPALLKRITPEGYSTSPCRRSPLEGPELRLADDLFTDDALVWDPIASRKLRYGPPEGPWLDVDWDALRLGIWTKPGAHFVCIEPWHGIADPEGFDGEFVDKPGVMLVPPGSRWQTVMRITLAQR